MIDVNRTQTPHIRLKNICEVQVRLTSVIPKLHKGLLACCEVRVQSIPIVLKLYQSGRLNYAYRYEKETAEIFATIFTYRATAECLTTEPRGSALAGCYFNRQMYTYVLKSFFAGPQTLAS